MLQAKEEKDHWLLSDERIRLFFVDPRQAAGYSLVVVLYIMFASYVQYITRIPYKIPFFSCMPLFIC